MRSAIRRLIVRVVAVAVLPLGLTAGVGRAQSTSGDFPQASFNYFVAMDDGVTLTADEIRGRNTWLMWTADNDGFWDYLAQRSVGAFDLLKVLDSRQRMQRFATYGLMNEPGFKQASAPDQFGLWLDVPDGTQDPAYAKEYLENFSKVDFLKTYGRASGIVGLRLFPNPKFDDKARKRWDAQRFYNDSKYYRDRKLVRPYRVGMACAFCHVGPHPLHPPKNPEQPGWDNLSSTIGSQYLKPAAVFVLPHQEDNFLFQVVNSMPPGTIDTSALATDNLNNPRNMNAIYQVGTRLKIAAEEKLSSANLELPRLDAKTPHVLKDGADSVGIYGALTRVYISIGAVHQEWLKHFNLLVGGTPETPFPVAKATREQPYFRATLDRMPNLAAFFIKASQPHPLARAPDSAPFLQDDPATVARGQQMFAENCAGCHVSPNKMPTPPAGIAPYSEQWRDWIRTDDYKSKMTAIVRSPDFLQDNYLSNDRRYPVNLIGTNACATLATNAMRGHVWDNFSSDTYKELPASKPIKIQDPFTGEERDYPMPGGGRGYQRVPSLVSIWASAPYLHNNSVGTFSGDPSVAGRIRAFQDAIEKMLWPEKRLGMGSIYRTTKTSWLRADKTYLPQPLFWALKARGMGMPGASNAIQLGPIPKGTPVNLLANIDLEPSLDPMKFIDFVALVVKFNAALRDIRGLDDAAAAARLKLLAPDLLKVSKCPDFVTDRGHMFGTKLPDNDKRALIAWLKRL